MTSIPALSLPLVVRDDIRQALAQNRAVVALESTIISHGMPYPQNLETAKRVEAAVQQRGAVPATIALMHGKVCIGLDSTQLEQLASQGPKCTKVSRRDILPVLASRGFGATTVAATMILANAAGIRVFVTGGIGGVHRGVQDTMDISADLCELGRTPVAVVCAGVKSILDIPKTLEFLETQGVTVTSFQADDFPAFFTRSSGIRSPRRIDSISELATIARQLPCIGSGMVVGVPVPDEEEAFGARVQQAIDQAVGEVGQKGIVGAFVTPYVLERVRTLTGGESLQANIRLVLNNARVGADIAVAMAMPTSKL